MHMWLLIFAVCISPMIHSSAFAKEKPVDENGDEFHIQLAPSKRRSETPLLETKEEPPRQDADAITLPNDYYKTSIDPKDDHRLPPDPENVPIAVFPPSSIQMKDLAPETAAPQEPSPPQPGSD